MMMTVLASSNTATMLLLRLMRPEQEAESVEFRCAHPASSLYSAAKTLLVIRKQPVAIVLDADSTEPQMADRAKDEALEVIGESATNAPLRILVAVPAIESLLFFRADAVHRAFGSIPSDLIELGLVSPGDALQRLQSGVDRYAASVKAITHLNQDDIDLLRTKSPVRELLKFLDELNTTNAQADAVLTS